MKKAVVGVKMFTLPNYMKLSGPVGDSAGIDVGALFANDEDAAEFWGECLDDWLEHVRKRRAALGKSDAHPNEENMQCGR